MRQVAWTRLSALALAIIMGIHALPKLSGDLWFDQAYATIELAGAALLVRSRLRGLGVMVGAAATTFMAMSKLLEAAFPEAFTPGILTASLLMLGARIDRERQRRRAWGIAPSRSSPRVRVGKRATP